MNFFANLLELWSEVFPPDVGVLRVGLEAILETIWIAFLGTMLGMLISLPFGILGARNFFPKRIVGGVRLVLAGIRTLPALLWAIVFVILVGFGVKAGILAMTMYTVGYLGKMQYEALEGVDMEPYYALKATGVSKLKLLIFVILPMSANSLLSQMLFMFDYNVRASSILGFVGAGGIGFYIGGYLKVLQYDKVMTLLLVVFVAVVMIDYLSIKIRDRWL